MQFSRCYPVGVDFEAPLFKALVDTGADHNHAAPSIIRSLGLLKIRTITVIGATGEEQSAVYEGQVFVPSIALGLKVEVIGLPQLDSRPYKLIIGSAFLGQGHLSVNNISGERWFDLYTNRDGRSPGLGS